MIAELKVLQMLDDELLADTLEEIAAALRLTVAMPRAAEAVDEAARRIRKRTDRG